MIQVVLQMKHTLGSKVNEREQILSAPLL